MRKISWIQLILAFFLAVVGPVVTLAQSPDMSADTVSASAAEKAGSSSVEMLSSDDLQAIENASGPEVEHGQIRLNQGVPRRISSSKADLQDIDIAARQVINKKLLVIYARHLVLTEPVQEMIVTDKSIEMTVNDSARLLGIIPLERRLEVTVSFGSGRITQVEVAKRDAWHDWLFGPAKTQGKIKQQIGRNLSGVKPLSTTQLKAYILEAVVTVFD
jgi:hypothetical protein